MKKIIVLLYLSLLFASSVFGISDNIEVSIRFYNKQIYYPESDIQLKVSVRNNGIESYSFNSAEFKTFNFLFTVKSLTNTKLPASDRYLMRYRSNNPVFYREITILPGEEYSFTTSLDEYVKIDNSGIYIVQAQFFPEFQKGFSSESLTSNSLTLSVRPSLNLPAFAEQIDTETGEILRQKPLPPDEVVQYTIDSRIQSSWNRFFLYMDIEGLLLNHPDLKYKYKNVPEEDQVAMIEEYREELKNQRVDNDILLVPSSYEILNTSYTPSEASVIVNQEFIYPDYTERKKYTYFLHRFGDIWTIYNYEVRNLGTD